MRRIRLKFIEIRLIFLEMRSEENVRTGNVPKDFLVRYLEIS